MSNAIIAGKYHKPDLENLDTNSPLGRRIYNAIMNAKPPTKEQQEQLHLKARKYEKELLAKIENA